MDNPSDSEALSDYWRQQVAACQASGLSGARFCKDQELVYHRFVYWRQKFDPTRQRQNGPSDTGGFAAVRVPQDGHCGLSLSLPNGLIVRGICAENVSVVRQLLDQF